MANKKFSEFVLKTSTSDVSHIVGYNGAENVQITPANFVTGGGTGVFLPLAGGTMTGALVVDSTATVNDILTAGLGLAVTGGAVGTAKLVQLANNFVYLYGGSSGLVLGNGDGTTNLKIGGDFSWELAGVQKMILNASGNLGIGVTPRAKLDVSGNVVINHTTGVTQTKLYVEGSEMPADGDPVSVEDIFTLYRYGSATVWSGAASLALGRYFPTGSAPRSRLDFKLKEAPGSNTALPEVTVMTMQANGFVGIGITNPTALLQLSGDNATASPQKIIKLGGAPVDGGGQYIQFSSSSNDSLGSQIQGSRVGAGGSSDLRFLTTTTGSVVSERMRIDKDGNVGIAVTPTTPLHVKGVLQVQNLGSNTFYDCDANGSFARTFGGNIYAFRNSAGQQFISINTNTGGITGSGNASFQGMTIGTDQTYGANYRTFSFGANSDGNNRIFADNGTSDGMYFAAATGRGFFFRPNGGTSNVFKILSGGSAEFTNFVGIGGASSAVRLTLTGTTGSYSTGIRFVGTGTGASVYSTFINTAGDLVFDDNTRGASRLDLKSDGDLRIRTDGKGLILASPNGTQYRITVANDGTITSTAV